MESFIKEQLRGLINYCIPSKKLMVIFRIREVVMDNENIQEIKNSDEKGY